MGAWGTGIFDNDFACDWVGELDGADDLTPVEAALDEVIETGDDYLDSDEASCALAAAEVIARLKGNWGKRDAYSEDLDNWVESHPQKPSDALVEKAIKVIDLVLGDDSELPELWDEGDDGPEWRAGVADLRKRVAGG